MDSFQQFVAGYVRLMRAAKTVTPTGLTPPKRPALSAGAPVVLVMAPHPDDECIMGAWPLRLMREAGMRVVDVAVTLGSNQERRAGRWAELQAACGWLGFGLELSAPGGLEAINPHTRQNSPGLWQGAVPVIVRILERHQPRAVFFPTNWMPTPRIAGHYHLVMDALRACRRISPVISWKPSFGRRMPKPNVMVESGLDGVADLISALALHVGEVQRNPYHVGLPAWLQDNVRRGAELVGGQGGAAPDYAFATLYRLSRWAQGGVQEVNGGRRLIGVRDNPAELLM